MSDLAAFRRAAPEDIPRMMEIRWAVRENRLSHPEAVTRADYERFIGANHLWVCEVAGTITGFSGGDERDGTIWALFLDPAWEGHGFGARLLHLACRDLAADGYRKATLSTDLGTKADRLYRRLGWQVVRVNDEGEVFLELDL